MQLKNSSDCQEGIITKLQNNFTCDANRCCFLGLLCLHLLLLLELPHLLHVVVPVQVEAGVGAEEERGDGALVGLPRYLLLLGLLPGLTFSKKIISGQRVLLSG